MRCQAGHSRSQWNEFIAYNSVAGVKAESLRPHRTWEATRNWLRPVSLKTGKWWECSGLAPHRPPCSPVPGRPEEDPPDSEPSAVLTRSVGVPAQSPGHQGESTSLATFLICSHTSLLIGNDTSFIPFAICEVKLCDPSSQKLLPVLLSSLPCPRLPTSFYYAPRNKKKT